MNSVAIGYKCSSWPHASIEISDNIYSLYLKKWYSQKKIILDMIFVQNVCV